MMTVRLLFIHFKPNLLLNLLARSTATKPKIKERCPHAERCYRKNPHHFKEFEHPHCKLFFSTSNEIFILLYIAVNNFLEKGEPLILPDGFPQEKEVVMEQLEVLKSLKKGGSLKLADINSVEVQASSSKTQRYREKTTSFVPNVQRNEIRNKSGSLTMQEKLQIAAPYNLFFTRIPESPETIKQPNSVTITGLILQSVCKLH